MFKIIDSKRVSNEIMEYNLENGDKLVLLDKDIEKWTEFPYETEVIESVQENKYHAVLSDTETTDDIAEIVGFEKVS